MNNSSVVTKSGTCSMKILSPNGICLCFSDRCLKKLIIWPSRLLGKASSVQMYAAPVCYRNSQ